MSQSILSDLCTVCHSEKPKYRCPKCKTQMCSLPCYKRHQQRASCSGQRDPAAYVKKSEWATPTGIDRDYNYLKRVERTIDDASQASNHGQKQSRNHPTRGTTKGWQPGSAMGKYLTNNRIDVQHAPVGMSRQKTNRTRTTKSGKVIWTVEWVDESGRCDVRNDCAESATLKELFSALQNERRNALKRQSGVVEGPEDRQASKRKRAKSAQKSKQKLNGPPQTANLELLQRQHPEGIDTSVEPTATLGSHVGNDQDDQLSDASSPPVQIITDSSPNESTTKQPSHSDSSQRVSSSEQIVGNVSAIHFYLLRPATVSAYRVLIPLKPGATLTQCLQDRSVQEYPTIYVLPAPPDSLGRDFLLEDAYLAQRPKAESLSGAEPGMVLSSNLSSQMGKKLGKGEKGHDGGALDAKSILDMLKRDVKI